MKNKTNHKLQLARLAFIAASHRDGFTFNIQSNSFQETGYAVAAAETQNSFGAEGLVFALEYARKHNIPCIGGWYNESNGQYYFDATNILTNRKAAIAEGKKNGQLAIFCLNNKREIKIA